LRPRSWKRKRNLRCDDMDEWTSPNGVWKIYRRDGWKIENLKTGFGDSPIVYDSGKVAFDYPELVPEYVKDRFKSMAGAYKQRVALVNARR